ncbi:hypothetical protein E3P86_02663 [Wallemia ichthyophaga]|uniref:Cytochrome c-type biogenesis protein H TPR domain-containing protein n=1 Tax=Wallemia ichthyophaga TaxID=245174 RepID=A0A4T0IZ34_WALIC|nr:hypothetical protein E3P86_02663 [Wallemia ichthyophaga]
MSTYKLADWAAKNKNLIIAATAVTFVGGAAASYYYSSAAIAPATASASTQKKKKKSKKSKKSSTDAPSPLLEELSPQDRDSVAQDFKSKGNKQYQQHQWNEAAINYSKAIESSTKPEAVFYSNRAACYNNLGDYNKVIDDCNEALKLDSEYVKALNRRAQAFEQLGNLNDALNDFTAATIIDQFRNDSAAKSVERVLKKLAETQAKSVLQSRGEKLPQISFIQAYLNAFRERTPTSIPEGASASDLDLADALKAADAKDFNLAKEKVEQSLIKGVSNTQLEAEALNLRGTFYFLLNNPIKAIADLEKSVELSPHFSQSWVKAASVYMELANPQAAFKAFDTAIEKNPQDADAYYHRGQVYFILSDFNKAIENYEKSVEIDDSFPLAQIQLAVAHYKNGNIGKAMAIFRTSINKFPHKSDVYTYYGELLMDQGKFEEAVEKFDKAIELDMDRYPVNVLPKINKALAIFQWKQDFNTAESLVRQAVTSDPENDVAIGTLAQLCLQQGKIDEAIEAFEKSAQVSRTEPELVNAITYEKATRAQAHFIKNHPNAAAKLGPLAQSMGAGGA